MTASRRVLVLGTIALILLPAASATAQQRSRDDRIRDQIDECIGDEIYPTGPPPSCTFDEEGNLIDRQFPGEGRSSGGMGGWILLGLLWAAVPMVIGASVASSRGQSVGVALLATFLLGWLGLVLIILMQKPDTSPAVRGPSEPTEADYTDEIRRLGELRAEGLLTDEEFQAKKSQLLGTS